jgi:hypothetical protein
VREERFECGGIASVALLTADVIAAVSRMVPIGKVVRARSIRPGEVAISAPALLGNCWRDESEYAGQNYARNNTEALHRVSPLLAAIA